MASLEEAKISLEKLGAKTEGSSKAQETSESAVEDAQEGIGEAFEFKDVTNMLISLRDELDVGEMIHGEDFRLFEAMSAIELMDPKMDAGMQFNQVMTIEKALKLGILPKDLTPEQLIGIFDELMACEMAWYDGNSVAHSVFTCMYLHDHETPLITNSTFKAYKDCLLKCCSNVMATVKTADIYDEEDFVTHQFSFKLGEDLDEEKILGALEHEIGEIQGKLEANQNEDECSLLDALLKRLHFRHGLLSFYSLLKKAPGNGAAGFNDAANMLTKTKQFLADIQETLDRGSSPAPGFDVSIAKLLITNAPPRQMPIMSRKDACEFLQKLFDHFEKCFGMQHLKEFKAMEYFMIGLSYLRSNVVVRSFLFMLVQGDANNWMGLKRTLSSILREQHELFSPTTKPYFDYPDMVTHLERLTHPILSQFRLYCESPPRQLRRIAQILDDWNILQGDATQLDAQINQIMLASGIDIHSDTGPSQYAFFSWTYDQTLQLLAHHIMLSIESELFANYELAYVYLYLDHLIDLRLQIYKMASRVPILTPGGGKKKQKAHRGKKRKKKGRRAKKANELKVPKQNPRPRYYVYIESHRAMARGSHILIQILTKLDIFKFPKCPFGSASLRYQHRFQDFARVPQPELLTYEQMKNQFEANIPVEKLIDEGLDQFDNVRSGLSDYLKDLSDLSCHPWGFDEECVRGCIKVATENHKLLRRLKKMCSGKIGKHNVTIEFETHRFFPCVKMQKVE